jgi:DSF synthase
LDTVNWTPNSRSVIDVVYRASARCVLVRFKADDVPSCTFDVVTEMHTAYDEIAEAVASGVDIGNMILSSSMKGIFNMGGDLAMMAAMARRQDRAGLAEYGRLTAGLVHRTWAGLGLPITTFAAVDGDAFGGGCEAALSANFTVASRAGRFAFPETRFGLFPGMGATSIVGRRASRAYAADLIGSGATLSADTAVARGLIDRVIAGRSETAILRALRAMGPAGQTRLATIAAARRRHARYSCEEAMAVVGVWVDAVMAAPERTLIHIERIVKAQKARMSRTMA